MQLIYYYCTGLLCIIILILCTVIYYDKLNNYWLIILISVICCGSAFLAWHFNEKCYAVMPVELIKIPDKFHKLHLDLTSTRAAVARYNLYSAESDKLLMGKNFSNLISSMPMSSMSTSTVEYTDEESKYLAAAQISRDNLVKMISQHINENNRGRFLSFGQMNIHG
jgi:hypothetical protein